MLEALADERICQEGGIALDTARSELGRLLPDTDPDEIVQVLSESDLVEAAGDLLRLGKEAGEAVRGMLDASAMGRPVGWGEGAPRHGMILAQFALHCRDELDGVEVAVAEEGDAGAARLVINDAGAETRIELRHSFFGLERLVGTPTLLIGDVAALPYDFLYSIAGNPKIRAAVAIYDLVHQQKVSAVRSTALVHLEWFLRDTYGVKLATSRPFTQGLIDKGVISLGFG